MSMVHLYVHGRGRGHGSRCRAVAEHLRAKSLDVRIFAGRDAIALFEPGDAEPVDSLMPGDGIATALKLKRRLQQAVSNARNDEAIAIVSDGDLPSATAGRLAKIPSIAVGHGLIFSHTRRPETLSAIPWRRQATKARMASAGSHLQVAVNFCPLEPKRSSTVIAKPILRERLNEALDTGRVPGDEVICYFRDANGEGVLRNLVQQGVQVRLFAKSNPKLANVEWEPLDSERFTSALLKARAVVSSAGSQLISECVALGIPQLALYDAKDDEQRLNVELLKAHNLGSGTTFSDIDTEALQSFVTGLNTTCGPSLDPWARSEHAGNAAEKIGEALDMIIATGPDWKNNLSWPIRSGASNG